MSRGDLPSERPNASSRSRARFGSQKAQQDWYRSAYRQMVEKDNWEGAELADPQTQAMLEAMPEKAAGQYFKDPNNKYRIIKPAQREDPNVMRHRLDSVAAWLDKLPAGTETRYADLAELGPDYPHPGEDEQVEIWMQQSRLFDPKEDYFRAGEKMTSDGKETMLAKAPPGGKAIIADIPFDQMLPLRFPTDHMPSQAPRFGSTGRVTTQPRDEIAPVILRESPASLTGQKNPNGRLETKNEITPPGNFASPAPQPYPSAPGILSTDKNIHALDLQPEELQAMRWDRLADKLSSRDNYNPRDFSPNFKNQGPRQNSRRGTSPEVAAQDAIDAAHELNLAKGRDWGTDLPRNDPVAIMGEYQHAVDTLVKEAGDFWSERVRREPLAAEIEMMRAYVGPRIVNYFPVETRDLIKSEIGQGTSPKIQSGPQGAQDLITALAFGEIREVVINGKKLNLSTTVQPEVVTNQERRYGSHGGLTAQRLNYLIGREVKKMLEACKEVSRAEVVGGPKKPMPNDRRPYERVKEYMLQDPLRRGIAGSVRTDVAIRLWYQGQDCVFHINTVDMLDDLNMSGREADAVEKALLNAIAMFQSFGIAEGRWEKRNKEGRLSKRNVIATAPKADSPDEEAIQRVLEDFLSRISCAKIIAECKKGAGRMDTLSIGKQ